jgi:hypothetical protein
MMNPLSRLDQDEPVIRDAGMRFQHADRMLLLEVQVHQFFDFINYHFTFV